MMYIIIGFSDPKIAGVNKHNLPAIFDPAECSNFRAAQTAQEEAACVACAVSYYNLGRAANKTTREFGLLPTSSEIVQKIAQRPELYDVILHTFNSPSSIKLAKCRYCGDFFIPNAPGQRVCKKKKCQTARRTDVMRAYKSRKKPAAGR